MRRLRSLLVCIAASLVLVSCGASPTGGSAHSAPPDAGGGSPIWPAGPEEHYSLTVGVTVAPDTPCGQALLAIKEELEARSNGAVTLDIYWESTLGGASEIAESVMTGTMDIGVVSSAIISRYTPAIDVFSLPFIIADREHFKAVADQYFDGVTAGMEDTLGIPLALWEFGFLHLCTTEKEVRTPEDCAGLAIRVMDGQIYSETFHALGCIPSNLAASELVAALQQRVVDGAAEPLATLVNQQQYTVCESLTLLGYNYSIACPVMSNEAADALPSHVLGLVKEVFYEYRYYAVDLGQEYEDRYIDACRTNGMTVIELSEEELARFQEAVAPVVEQYADRIGRELIDKVSSAAGSAQ